jgi:hypothetical protein
VVIELIPVQALTVPEDSRSLRLPDFMTTHEGGKVVSPTHWPTLLPMRYSWYSFLLEDELKNSDRKWKM